MIYVSQRTRKYKVNRTKWKEGRPSSPPRQPDLRTRKTRIEAKNRIINCFGFICLPEKEPSHLSLITFSFILWLFPKSALHSAYFEPFCSIARLWVAGRFVCRLPNKAAAPFHGHGSKLCSGVESSNHAARTRNSCAIYFAYCATDKAMIYTCM